MEFRPSHFEIVRLIIQEFKMNVYQTNYFGETPLILAIQNLETCRFLLENGATVNNSGGRKNALGYAASVGAEKPDVVRLPLVAYRADPNLYRWGGGHNFTLTDTATMDGNAEILRLLLEYGALLRHIIVADLPRDGTTLNVLLCNPRHSVAVKTPLSAFCWSMAKM